jgi:hypothetical protein
MLPRTLDPFFAPLSWFSVLFSTSGSSSTLAESA